MEEYTVYPPDGGYGWIVVISAFFTMGLTRGVMRNFGMFFLDIQHHYGVYTSTLSWVDATRVASFHLGAPFGGVLSTYLTQRYVIMIGATLASSGMIIGSLGLGLPWLHLSIGVLQGFGCSLCWMSVNSMVNLYFKRWRPIALSISSSGECVFSMAFSPLSHWLVEMFSWQGALLIMGGLQFNLWACAALMRPLKPKPLSQRKLIGGSEDLNLTLKKAPYQWSLICKPELLLYFIFATLITVSFLVPPLFVVPYTSQLGVKQYWAASLLSVLALSDLLGRLACGWLANLRLLRNLQLLVMVTTMLGVVLLLLPFGQGYWPIVAFITLYGFLLGSVMALHIISIVDIVGPGSFDSALGLFMLVKSSGAFVSLPAAGWLVDCSGDFRAVFYMCGLCSILSAVFVVVVDVMVEKTKRKKTVTDLGKSPHHNTESDVCSVNRMNQSEA